MIVRTNTSDAPPRLRRWAWIAATCAVPLGVVHCDRPDASATPSDETMEPPAAAADANGAVQAGDADAGGANANIRLRRKRAAAFRSDLDAKVAAGEITREEAEERMTALRNRMAAARGEASTGGTDDSGDEMPAWYTEGVEKVQAMLDAGEITDEQARQRFERLRARVAAESAAGAEAEKEKE